MTKYADLLRDPRWQRKRLEILKRDDFRCQACHDDSSTLNVHHCYYEYDNDPWDYEDKSLVTLCESCHSTETKDISGAKKQLHNAMARHGFQSTHLDCIADGFANWI